MTMKPATLLVTLTLAFSLQLLLVAGDDSANPTDAASTTPSDQDTSSYTLSTGTPMSTLVPATPTSTVWLNATRISITETVGATFGRVSLAVDFANAVQGVSAFSAYIGYEFNYISSLSPFEIIDVPIDSKASPTVALVSRLTPYTLYTLTLRVRSVVEDSQPLLAVASWPYNTSATYPVWNSSVALSLVSFTNASILLSFPAPQRINGPEPLVYSVSYTALDANPLGLGPVVQSFPGNFASPINESLSLVALAAGVLYNISLTAFNSDPLARPSRALSVQVRTAPAPVAWGSASPRFSTVFANATSLVIRWSPPMYVQDDASSLQYKAVAVPRSPFESISDEAVFPTCNPTPCLTGLVNASEATATFSDLLPSTSYKFFVSAYNSLRVASNCPLVYIAKTVVGPPSWGSTLSATATAVNDTHVLVDWSPGVAVPNDDPEEIRYKVVRVPDGKVVLEFFQSTADSLSFCCDSGLVANANYSYFVFAKNSGSFSLNASVIASNVVSLATEDESENASVLTSVAFIAGMSSAGGVLVLVTLLIIALRVCSKSAGGKSSRKGKRGKRPTIVVDHPFSHSESMRSDVPMPVELQQVRTALPIRPPRKSSATSHASSHASPTMHGAGHDYDEISLRAALQLPDTDTQKGYITISPSGRHTRRVSNDSAPATVWHRRKSSLPSVPETVSTSCFDLSSSVSNSKGSFHMAPLLPSRSASVHSKQWSSPPAMRSRFSAMRCDSLPGDLPIATSSPKNKRTDTPSAFQPKPNLSESESSSTDTLTNEPKGAPADDLPPQPAASDASARTAHIYALPIATPAVLYGEYITAADVKGSALYEQPQDVFNNSSSSEQLLQSSSRLSSATSWFAALERKGSIVSQPSVATRRPSLEAERGGVDINGVLCEGYASTVLLATVPAFWATRKPKSRKISRESNVMHVNASHRRKRSNVSVGSDTSGGAAASCIELEDVHDGVMKTAVKVLKQPFDTQSYHCRKFAEEAHMLLNFNHPNIVKSLAFFGESLPAMLVMEFAPYFDLHSLLYSCRNAHPAPIQPTANEALFILYQVASALVYLESQGVVHSEIAARNCLVGSELTLKLCDFGHATTIVSGDGESAPMHTSEHFLTRWAAPEMFHESRVGFKSDVWQFGILCYEIYSEGNLPYHFLEYTQIPNFLMSGQRLERPEHCPAQLYTLMLDTWNWHEMHRPSASQVESALHVIRDTICEPMPIRDLGRVLREHCVDVDV